MRQVTRAGLSLMIRDSVDESKPVVTEVSILGDGSVAIKQAPQRGFFKW
jgi:hypothetical protein